MHFLSKPGINHIFKSSGFFWLETALRPQYSLGVLTAPLEHLSE